jgi:NADPH:quinone reductase-like Zn-dependent oxidoreductase
MAAAASAGRDRADARRSDEPGADTGPRRRPDDPGEVLVQVAGTVFNPVDTWLRAGLI